MSKTISIKNEFGLYTGLRHVKVSEKSGEEFYHKILNKEFKNCLEKKEILIVDLDGVRGYSPSFIDEAFGNLIYDFGLSNVTKYLRIKSQDKPFWKDSIENETYKLWEHRRLNRQAPVKTVAHENWWKFENDKLTFATNDSL